MNALKALIALITLTALALPAAAQNIQIVPGAKVYYLVSKDPITDENRSMLIIPEINDTDAKTFIRFKCVRGTPEAFLVSKNELVSADNWDADLYPTVTFRVDTQQPKTLQMNGVQDTEGGAILESLGFESDQTVIQALSNAKSKVVFRVNRIGLSPLDFTFSPKGFAQGMKAIGNCK